MGWKKILVTSILIFVIGSVRGAKTLDRNQTSISTDDGGCRFYVEDIIFTKTEPGTGSKLKSTTVYVAGDHLMINETEQDPPCGNYSGTIILNYQNIPYKNPDDPQHPIALDEFMLTWEITYVKKFGWWEVTGLTLIASGAMIDEGHLYANWSGPVMQSVAMGAAEKFNYACSKPNLLMYSDNRESKPTYKLQFKNLHLQPFYHANNFTNNVDDCVAFFSASVWMSLGSLLLFVLIILSGVVMLSNMVTVNRFDDPKAPQLVILAKE